jgi:hypothetical protein
MLQGVSKSLDEPRLVGKPAAISSKAGLRRLNQPAYARFAIDCRGL